MERRITVPDMILWTGTRIALGAGVGMLVSRGLSSDARKAAGIALTLVGAFTTFPLAMAMFSKRDQLREIKSVA